MTPEERAAALCEAIGLSLPSEYNTALAAIRAAVADEREACAVVVDETDLEFYAHGHAGEDAAATLRNAAAAIRARSGR